MKQGKRCRYYNTLDGPNRCPAGFNDHCRQIKPRPDAVVQRAAAARWPHRHKPAVLFELLADLREWRRTTYGIDFSMSNSFKLLEGKYGSKLDRRTWPELLREVKEKRAYYIPMDMNAEEALQHIIFKYDQLLPKGEK